MIAVSIIVILAFALVGIAACVAAGRADRWK